MREKKKTIKIRRKTTKITLKELNIYYILKYI